MKTAKYSANFNPANKASAKALQTLASIGFISSQVLAGRLQEAERRELDKIRYTNKSKGIHKKAKAAKAEK